MPLPSYRPDGSASATPTARSITEVERIWPRKLRASPSIFSGISAIACANSSVFGRISVPPSTSNWFTVRFTASRSSARRAPISYTPPVKPPPPRTRAVRERRGRRRFGLPTVFRSFWDGFSSLTTSPIRAQYDRSVALASVFSALDAKNRASHAGPPRAPARRRGGPGAAGDRQASHARDAPRRRLRGGLRGGRRRAEAARDLPVAGGHPADPRVQREALHHHGRARPVRRGGHPGNRGARKRPARRRGHLPRQPLPSRRRRPDLRLAPLRPALIWRRRGRRRPRRAGRGRRDPAGDRPRLWRRVLLRLPARRPRVRLRRLALGRPAE